MNEDREDIERAEAALRLAMLGSDADELSRLIHDDLLFVGPQGHVLSKPDDLAFHRSGAQRITRLDVQEQHIEHSADLAVVTVLADMAGVFRAQGFAGRFRYLRVWRRTDCSWQVVAASVVASAQD